MIKPHADIIPEDGQFDDAPEDRQNVPVPSENFVVPDARSGHTYIDENDILEWSSSSSEDEEDKSDIEENGNTIRPTRSPSVDGGGLPVSKAVPPSMAPILEDYSDLGGDDDDDIEDKVADFKVSCSPSEIP